MKHQKNALEYIEESIKTSLEHWHALQQFLKTNKSEDLNVFINKPNYKLSKDDIIIAVCLNILSLQQIPCPEKSSIKRWAFTKHNLILCKEEEKLLIAIQERFNKTNFEGEPNEPRDLAIQLFKKYRNDIQEMQNMYLVK